MMGERVHWSGRMAFILAASGSAIGLGNLWKFPYIAGTNGGGAFVLVYLLCIAAVGVPIFMAELFIGSQSQKNAVEAFSELDRPRSPWRVIGWLGLVSAVLILSFYSVVGGWVLDFEWLALSGQLTSSSEEQVQAFLGGLFASPSRILFWHSVFMLLVVGIAWGGVRKGLERWNNILMPTLVALLVVLLVYATRLDGFSESISFLFSFDFSALSRAGLLEAVGHSFFTLSLGMGAIITYGSYLQKQSKIGRIALSVAFLDTLIALIAGIIIFSIVFSFGAEPGQGPTLMFQTLPLLFLQMPGAQFVAIAFFLLVAVAALTSAVSLLEVIVAYWEDRGHSRKRSVLLWGGVIYLMGILAAFSFNLLADFKLFGKTYFDWADLLTSSYFLPIGGLLIAIFFGWKLLPAGLSIVFGEASRWNSGLLLWTTRIIAPLAVLLVLLWKVFGGLFSA